MSEMYGPRQHNTVKAFVVATALSGFAFNRSAAEEDQQVAEPRTTATSTEKRPVTDVLHGTTIVDNYRWLEGDNSDPKQMGKITPEVTTWTDQQNAQTRSVLDNLPGRKELEERLRPLMEIGAVTSPVMRGDRYFYTKREGKENQPKIMLRKGSSGEPQVLLDLAASDPSGLTALGDWAPSQDGKILAFSTYRAGDENTTISFLDVDTGAVRVDTLQGKAEVIHWLPDSSGLFYRHLADVKNPYSTCIMFHRLGTEQTEDKVLFAQYTKEENEKLATTWGPRAEVSKDGRWMALTYWTSTSSNDIWAVDLSSWWKDGRVGDVSDTGTFERVVINEGATNKFSGKFGPPDSPYENTFFMLTDYGAAKNRIVAVDMNNPSEADWKEIIPENKEAVLTGFDTAGNGMIVCTYMETAKSSLRMFTMDGTPRGELALPGIGTATVKTAGDRTEAYLSFTSFNYPSTVFQVDLAKPEAAPVVWERPDVPVDPTTVEVKQVFYQSKDGTTIPMFIIHKKGLELNNNNPTILYGYGGFDISMTPSFSPTLFPWFEDGGVYAVANLRGGGEFGKPWHEAGMLGSKQNVFDDMTSAAEYLIDNGYTNPRRLGASGSSNGGLLTGAMMTQQPHLFRAIYCGVPLLDMLRYQDFLMARYWVPEYGTSENPEHFKWLKNYSPYQNIKQGVEYPAVLFTAGENDARTHPMHARKMAAAMQEATASEPSEKPVLLWVDRASGHGQGKPLHLRIRDAADMRMFFMWQLGMLKEGAPK